MPQQNRLLDEFVESLAGKAETTISTYRRELRQFLSWIFARPGNGGRFRPEHLTKTALETYLVHLERAGHSISHRARVKSAVASFARWLIEEKNLLRHNPARGWRTSASRGSGASTPRPITAVSTDTTSARPMPSYEASCVRCVIPMIVRSMG